METAIKKQKTTFFETKDSEKSVFNYDLIMRKINELKRFIDAGIIEKQKPVNGFTAEDWKEFNNGISIEEYASKRGILL